MVIRSAERGNDLTKRTVDVYTLEELASCNIEQIIAEIGDFARVVQALPADPTEDEKEDSCAQIANDVLGKSDCLLEAVRNKSVTRDLVAIIAIHLGQLRERLEWMWRHTEAARKGYRRKNHEELAQRKGAEANKKNRRDNVNKVANLLKSKFSPAELRSLGDSALARHLAKSDLGGFRTIRDYVAEARNRNLIPPRREM
jgi:hypothetical protein